MGAAAAATRRTRQTRAKAAADAAPLAGDGRGSWWACCNSRLLGRSTSTTSCLLPAGRWHRSGVRAGPERAAPVAGAKGTRLCPPPLRAARTSFRLRARGKPVEKLVLRRTWADARCQHLAPRARKQSVRPFLGASHQTSPRPDPSRAPPSRADWTSPRPGQSAEGMGELNFWRELGMLMMKIFKFHL